MYPRDNIFNIYYNIGRIVPFQVKRADRGFQALPQNLYKPSGRTFMLQKSLMTDLGLLQLPIL